MRNCITDESAFLKSIKEKELIGAGQEEIRIKIYIPLVKNVISDRELMWADESGGTVWGHDTAKGFMRRGRTRMVPYPWIYHVRKWNEVGTGTKNAFLYSSDSTFMWYNVDQKKRPSYIEWKSGPECFIMTNKKVMLFKSNRTGMRIILRLIDDRIANATGADESYTVTYPASQVILGKKVGWLRNWSEITDSVLAESKRGNAYLMYRWNVIQEGDKPPTISLPEPDPYIYS